MFTCIYGNEGKGKWKEMAPNKKRLLTAPLHTATRR